MSTILGRWGAKRADGGKTDSNRRQEDLAMHIVVASLFFLNSMMLVPCQAADSSADASSTAANGADSTSSTTVSRPDAGSSQGSTSSGPGCMTADQTDPTKAVTPANPPTATGNPANINAASSITNNSSIAPSVPSSPDVSRQAPPPSGKPQIALQFPSHKLLLKYIRMRPYAAMDRIKSLSTRVKRQLEAGGMDPNIDFDTATQNGRPIMSIYIRPSTAGDNALSKGFKVEASICYYVRKPSGRVDLLNFQKIGESAEVYSPADFENKAAGLVDLYLTMRAQHIREAKKAKPVPAKRKTR